MGYLKSLRAPLALPSDAQHAYSIGFPGNGYSSVDGLNVERVADELVVSFSATRSDGPLDATPITHQGAYGLPIATVSHRFAVALSYGVDRTGPEARTFGTGSEFTTLAIYVLHPDHAVNTFAHEHVGDIEEGNRLFPVHAAIITLH